MEEKKKQAVESGSLYMTLDAFYRPVYLSMRGQGEEGFSRYISNNVRSHTTEGVSKLTFACYLFLFRHGLHGKYRFSLFFFREIREIRA